MKIMMYDKASGLKNINPDNFVERFNLVSPEKKTGHDGIYDELLKMCKQLFSINVITQE